MKTNYRNILLCSLFLIGGLSIQAQTITLSIENASITTDGSNDFYEADIMISSTTAYSQGSGQFFLDYNTAAFGTNIFASSGITYVRDQATSILGAKSGFSDFYGSYTTNDNTTSKVSYSWQQFLSEGVITDNITSTPAILVHVKMQYIDSAEPANVCFDAATTSFDDQFYTACGPVTPNNADCGNEPGVQIFNYTPDCTNATPTLLNVGGVDLNSLENIILYPNPAKDSFRLSGLENSTRILIYSLTGKLVLEQEIYEGKTIDISNLSSGIYIVKTSLITGVIIKKLVKK